MSSLAEQLKAMGHEIKEEGDRVSFPFKIETGRLAGTEITLGFVVTGDFLLNPPSGPHVHPRLLPMNNTQAPHPVGGVSDSAFGTDWQYWSRPIKHWQETPRNAAAYMAHIRRLFDTL